MCVAETERRGCAVFDIDEKSVAVHVASVADAEDGGNVETPVDEGCGAVVREPIFGGWVCDVEVLLNPVCVLDESEVGGGHFLEEDY